MDLLDYGSAARLPLPIVDDLLTGAAFGLLLSPFLNKDVVRDAVPGVMINSSFLSPSFDSLHANNSWARRSRAATWTP